MPIFDEPSKQPLPNEPTLEDHRLAVIKGGLSAIPVVGGVLAEEMGLLLITPLARRRDEWWEDVARRLRDVEGKIEGFVFENLQDNEQFVSAMIQATQSATKTHLKEKLHALRNAVLNVALGKEPSPDRQQQFLVLLDRFSETHVVVLKFLNDPQGYCRRAGKKAPIAPHVGPKLLVNNMISEAMPEIRASSSNEEHSATPFQFVELILGDLVSCRLVTLERLNDTWAVPPSSTPSGGGPIGKMATHLGEDFLAFITEPDI